MFSYLPLSKTLKERGIGIDVLAKQTGIRQGVLVSRMNGGAYLPMEYLDKICEVLNEPVERVVVWKAGKQKKIERVNINWDKASELIDKSDFSLSALSEACRLEESSLCQARKRRSSLTEQTAVLLAEKLGCKLEDIVD